MKIFAILLLGVLVPLCLAVAGTLALTGNLSKEALGRLMHPEQATTPTVTKEEAKPALGAVSAANFDAAAKGLKERSTEIERQELELKEKKQRVDLAQRDLDAVRADLKKSIDTIEKSMQTMDAQSAAALQEMATSVSQMKPDKARDTLLAMDKLEPGKAVKILRLIKERDRVKILNALEAQEAARFLSALEEMPAAPETSSE